MVFVITTDCRKSVRNRCEIEVFGGVFVLFCACRDFCHRTKSDLFLFLLVTLAVKGSLKIILSNKSR